MSVKQRSARGLPPDEALERWSDPAEYAAMKECEDNPRARYMSGGDPLIAARRNELRRRIEELEEKFHQKLVDAEVIASGVQKYARHREPIDPSLWDVLWVNDDLDDISGNGLIFEEAEFFEPNAIPRNIPHIPDWLADRATGRTPRFEASPDYRHISLGQRSFTLGPIQAKVVQLLHEASEKGDEWQVGKQLLGKAGSQQDKLIDLFKTVKGWRELIQADGRGQYRLKKPGV